MMKFEKLRKLYDELELDTTEDRVLLSKVKNRTASPEEVDKLLDVIRLSEEGGKKLDAIKIFESNLITDINADLAILEEITAEDNDISHLEDEIEQEKKYKNLKRRYGNLVKKIEDTLETMRIAYFQINSYHEFEDRFEKAKEMLGHLED